MVFLLLEDCVKLIIWHVYLKLLIFLLSSGNSEPNSRAEWTEVILQGWTNPVSRVSGLQEQDAGHLSGGLGLLVLSVGMADNTLQGGVSSAWRL